MKVCPSKIAHILVFAMALWKLNVIKCQMLLTDLTFRI